jgi:hypothetical protein
MISYHLNFLNNVLTYLSGEIIYNIRYNIKFRPKNNSSKFLVCTDEVYKLNIAEKYMEEREIEYLEHNMMDLCKNLWHKVGNEAV